MPFTPLPATFVEDLRPFGPLRAGCHEVLELGSGDGLFADLLRREGVEPVTLDRRRRATGAAPVICGDALEPPLRARFRVVVAANLLRHLWPRVRANGPRRWRDLVAPDGCLWIFEDEPLANPPAARHYRDLQALLAGLDPRTRGPLLASGEFRRQRCRWDWTGRWRDGTAVNHWPLSAPRIVEFLSAGLTGADGDAARLVAAIGRDGVTCGRYWWSRWQPEAI